MAQFRSQENLWSALRSRACPRPCARMAAPKLSTQAQKFGQWLRDYAQLLGAIGGGVAVAAAGIAYITARIVGLTSEVQKERELRELAVQAAVAQGEAKAAEAEAKMANRLFDASFAEEFKEWRRDRLKTGNATHQTKTLDCFDVQ